MDKEEELEAVYTWQCTESLIGCSALKLKPELSAAQTRLLTAKA
jgi:hypothetical protein